MTIISNHRSIHYIISKSTANRYDTESHALIIRRILHVKEIRPDWENEDWVFQIILDSEKYMFHIRTPINKFGTDVTTLGNDWRMMVAKKYGNPRDEKADRDEELAKELFSYRLACKKRADLLEAIDAYYTKRNVNVSEELVA